ncbi:hypothetical protein, partial [Chitinivibrio alkaliphilus]|uniref:hypothetical protein n=1 Tax=Chitinivibrio alkaliphilus TaxID=1505232 RepID=UPI00054F3925
HLLFTSRPRRSAAIDSITLLSVTDLDSTSRVALYDLSLEIGFGLLRREIIKDGYTYTLPKQSKPEKGKEENE